MNRIRDFLKDIENDNSRIALASLIDKLNNYMEIKDSNIYNMDREDLDLFIKRELGGKSNTTIASTISRLKKLFKGIDKSEIVEGLNLNYVKSITEVKRDLYLTPEEVYKMIEELINYQDKALVLLCYMGLYDNNFDTISHLKTKQIDFKNKVIKLNNGKEIKLNGYCLDILEKAAKEDEVEKYIFQENRRSTSYKLNTESEYFLKSKKRQGGVDVLPPITLKKKIELYGRWVGIEKLTPISLKNSRVIYDIVKLEYETNCGLEINQLELKNILKENNIPGTIEQLNMSKKVLRMKIIKEIIEGKTWFID